MFDERIRMVAEAALPGEQLRGDSGVVFINMGGAVYKLLVEVESEELRDQLEDLLTENGRSHVVVVEENVDDASKRVVAHVWMVSRSELMRVSAR